MNISNIFEKRDCGELKIKFATNWDYPLKQILSGFGLSTNDKQLQEVTKQQAREILVALLWKDLAYSGEIMPHEEAIKISEYFVSTIIPANSIIYSNALWQNYHGSSSFGFNPFTSATFDGGIIAVNKNMAISFWVEDED